ncbi:dTDP-4-dehydrorhamnose reductase [Roseomonas frigidaquae]|uniref:dTDP-4-dehydrorhamnose reductase n=1 Tax=Falsiroseomonas frigidaquae TaxID=487318 RepID=A0ABX1F0F2_9PROT|nr:dTDP-4-dehydrorhamnose reductase [Falsiroseomonas frigidaquae]NKE45784.1 dTDP-4-dehydrorhamnose reductase [Falsiroseomonas frigidaquae]
MRVLVAGREGQVARALVARLADHQVVALEPPELDLTDDASVAAAMARARPDLVVNAAAYTAVDKAEDQEALAFAVNCDGAARLAAAAADAGAPFVHFSTDYVFDGLKGAPYLESDAPSPLGVYGRSKEAGERAVLAANPRSVVLRTAWVCSPDGANFVKTMLRLAAEREELRVVADQHGAPTFAADLADAVAVMAPRLLAAAAEDAAFGLFHLTGSPHTTWHGFTAEILAQAATRGHRQPRLQAITTSEFPTRAVRPVDGRLDCSRIGQVHGITPADWRQSLARCLDTLVANTPTRDTPTGPAKENSV